MEELGIDLQGISDAAVVVAIGRWRPDALAEAYRRHGGAVFSLALRVLRDRGRAEDVTQTVFTTLWEEADRFDPERGSLRSYLLTMAHRRSVDIVRSEDRRRDREVRLAGLAEAPYDLEREAWDLAVGERVRAALGTLGEAERQAIEMAYFGGHTYREVAGLLGEPEGTVKSRIRYGLRRLRTALVDVGAVER
ncbi:MAG TPA: sigma-70 family RNA polymerase sigma factor [Acidimicrobiales bacterium]|nr:sigma-70 family RNA polymerase sigma factor [Acidimicrobiales bacterium]